MSLSGDKKRDYRLGHSKPVVDQFFQWCQIQLPEAENVTIHDIRAKALTDAKKAGIDPKNRLATPPQQ